MKQGLYKKTKRILAVITGIFLFMGMIVLLNFFPTFRMETNGMRRMEGEHVCVFYETCDEAAKDVFSAAESRAAGIAERLGLAEGEQINIYIYDKQSTMQTKKYGLIGPLLGLNWYIGDNRGTNVILTSPQNPGAEHTYQTVKDAALHEMVHAFNSILNPQMPLWINEGLALYLSNGDPYDPTTFGSFYVPTFPDIQTRNPIRFNEINGYMLAHTYIEYIESEYGWERVLTLARTGDYEEALARSAEEIYDEWVIFLKNYDS